MRILIADDHEMVRDTLTVFLNAEGRIQVLSAGTLDEALQVIDAKGPFDLVLLETTRCLA